MPSLTRTQERDMPIDDELLQMLVCPVAKTPLRHLAAEELARINDAKVRAHIDATCITITELADSLVALERQVSPQQTAVLRPRRLGHGLRGRGRIRHRLRRHLGSRRADLELVFGRAPGRRVGVERKSLLLRQHRAYPGRHGRGALGLRDRQA